MADEEKKEVIEEAEISEEVVNSMKAFDEKINSDDEDSAIEDNSDDIPEEEEVAEDEIPAEEKKEEEVTAEEDIEAEIAKLEKEPTAEPEKKVEEKPEEKADEEKPYDCGLDPDVYEPELIESVNKLGQNFTNEIKTLKSEKTELENLVKQQETQRYTDWFDRKINSLGDDFVEIYGEGEIDDLEPGSEQFENRAKLDQRIALTVQAYKKMGKPVPSRNKLFRQAVSYLNKEIVNKAESLRETKKKLSERRSQVIGRASKKGTALSATELAAKAMKDFDNKIDE